MADLESKESTLQETEHQHRWITREEIINAKWMWLTDKGGYWGDMELLENGKIKGYDHPNERQWQLRVVAHGYTILEFYGEGNRKTRSFPMQILDTTGKWKLSGNSGYLIQIE